MKYHPSFAARVRDLCYVGAPNSEIAALLGITVETLTHWREQYPEFDYAWKDGKAHADAKVAKALFQRACGYDMERWKETRDGRFRETVHVPADVSACVFWLTNKRPDQWSKTEHTNVTNVVVTDALTDIEAARHIAFALSKAMYAAIEDKTIGVIENGSVRTENPETK